MPGGRGAEWGTARNFLNWTPLPHYNDTERQSVGHSDLAIVTGVDGDTDGYVLKWIPPKTIRAAAWRS